jgi:hypothetical protein
MNEHSPADFRAVSLTVSCLNIRHKLMYVDDRQAMPGMIDIDSDTRIYFCTKTHEQLGPDDQPVGPAYCTGGRVCYCAPAI